MVKPDAVAQYSPFGPVSLVKPAGQSVHADALAVVDFDAAADGDVEEAAEDGEDVEVAEEAADFDGEVLEYVDVDDSFANAGAAAKAANANIRKSFFILFS